MFSVCKVNAKGYIKKVDVRNEQILWNIWLYINVSKTTTRWGYKKLMIFFIKIVVERTPELLIFKKYNYKELIKAQDKWNKIYWFFTKKDHIKKSTSPFS